RELAPELTELMQFLRRLTMAVHREKAALMTRGRLPSLVYQFRQLDELVANEVTPLVEEARALLRINPASNDSPDAFLREIRDMTAELLGVEADILLAGGHPHSAARRLTDRILVLLNRRDQVTQGWRGLHLAYPKFIKLDKHDQIQKDCFLAEALRTLDAR